MHTITTFAPDASPLTPGIAVSVTNAYPSENGGMKAMPTAKAFSDALDGPCLGAFAFQDLSNNFRTIAGTAAKLYELSSLSFADVSAAGGYSATRWRFAGWGDYILATNFTDALQVQTTGAGDFADVATAPQAAFITASNNFVILANISGYTNRIQWCAQGDYTDWTPSLSTMSGYYDINDTPGPITGLARAGNNIVVFKERCTYLGTFVGSPYVWNFQLIQGHSGTYSQESVIELETGLFYVGLDDFYFFDGTTPKPIGAGIRTWFFNNLDRNYQPNIIGVYDGIKRMAMWFYPTGADGTSKPVEGVIFDIRTQRWGRVVQSVEAALVHWSAGVTYDTLINFFATYTILEANAPYYDSPWWSAKSFGLAVVGEDHKLAFFNDTPATGQIVTGDSGSQKGYSRTTKAWPYFNLTPTACTITSKVKTRLGDVATTVGTAQNVKADGSVDLDCSGKFTSLQLDMAGDWEIVGFETDTAARSVN